MNVPNIAGIPNIPNMPDFPNPFNLSQAGANAAIGFGGGFVINKLFGDQWGIFNQFGVPILLADNVTSIEYSDTATIASAPLEKGTFTTYNKVQAPYSATVQMTKGGGDVTARGAFIAQLEMLSRSTLQYHVLTPEFVHKNATITGFSYKRTPTEGARMIVANIDLKELREITVSYSRDDTANPDDRPILQAGITEVTETGTLPVETTAKSSLAMKLFKGGKSAFDSAADYLKNKARGFGL